MTTLKLISCSSSSWKKQGETFLGLFFALADSLGISASVRRESIFQQQLNEFPFALDFKIFIETRAVEAPPDLNGNAEARTTERREADNRITRASNDFRSIDQYTSNSFEGLEEPRNEIEIVSPRANPCS